MRNSIAVEPVRVPARSSLLVLAAAVAVYLVALDNGLALGSVAGHVHELFHDGRHFLGVPCH